MKLTFIGADHEVTGSESLLQVCGKNILIDCGMEQGKDIYANMPLPVKPEEIDYLLVTHAHIDHTGMIPALVKAGFSGAIHATEATCRLSDIMLRDSAHIQEFEAEWRNRKGARKGEKPFEPIYVTADAEAAIKLFIPHDYEKDYEICDGVKIRFTDAGHLLGSSNITITMKENGIEKSIIFSGDIGNVAQPIIRDPSYPTQGADYAVTESTYGTRVHDAPPDYAVKLAEVLQTTFDRNGSVIVPSFAVGRTQEILYFIREIKTRGLLKGHDSFTVYVDSPLAIEATKIFHESGEECFDDAATELVRKGIDPISFEGLKVATSSDESRAINFDDSCKVIISASGMCEAGRIKHHLKHHLWRKQDTILFVGYQAARTLGRSLLDGAKNVKLFGEDIAVNAEIKELPGISGHADSNGLIKWITSMEKKPDIVFVNHGESDSVDQYAARLRDEFGFNTATPYSGSVYDLADGSCIFEAKPEPLAEKTAGGASAEERGMTDDYRRFVEAADRLNRATSMAKGRSNRELRELAGKINEILGQIQA